MEVFSSTTLEVVFVSLSASGLYNLQIGFTLGIRYKGSLGMSDKSLEVYTEILSLEVRRPAIGVGGKFGEEHLGLLALRRGCPS